MTLDELRAALERGTLGGGNAEAIDGDATQTAAARQLYQIATSHKRGPRLLLPHDQMPVLP